MLFTLEPLPAAEGDCLLLHWGTAATPHVAIIDGGPGRIFEDQLEPRLDEIRAARGESPLPLDLVMVSHADRDHIVGIKKLFRKLKAEAEANLPGPTRSYRAVRLWHNTFNDVLGDTIDAYYQTLTASVTAAVDGQPTKELIDRLTAKFVAQPSVTAADAAEDAWDVGLVLAGHADARVLRLDHKYLFDRHLTNRLNSPFTTPGGDATLLTLERTPAPVSVAGLDLQIVGPGQAQIEALQKAFDAYIKSGGLTVEAVLAAYADKSVTNLSSITCIASHGGKRILLTGDARGDFVLDGLRSANLLDHGSVQFDVLKVPHHGSSRNVEAAFFQVVTADAYVFSGDGKHGNPDRDTLEWLIDSRKESDVYDIYLTYPVDETDAMRKHEAEKHGQTWKPSRDSLRALFDSRAAQGFKFRVQAGAPFQIDLGDEGIAW